MNTDVEVDGVGHKLFVGKLKNISMDLRMMPHLVHKMLETGRKLCRIIVVYNCHPGLLKHDLR